MLYNEKYKSIIAFVLGPFNEWIGLVDCFGNLIQHFCELK